MSSATRNYSESEESERVEPKSSGKVGVIRGGELVAAVENANGNRVRDSLLRVGTTGVHENERGESGNLDEFFRETNFPRDVGRNANRTSLTFLPENVNEYGPVNVMYFVILIGMISGAYLLARAPATKDSSAEKLAEKS